MSAPYITDAQFETEVLKSEIPVVVDFYAEWCGPCKLASPVIDKLSEEFKGKVKIVKLDVDENPETPQKYGVLSIPTVILIDGGEEKERKVGYGGEQGYRGLIDAALGSTKKN